MVIYLLQMVALILASNKLTIFAVKCQFSAIQFVQIEELVNEQYEIIMIIVPIAPVILLTPLKEVQMSMEIFLQTLMELQETTLKIVPVSLKIV